MFVLQAKYAAAAYALNKANQKGWLDGVWDFLSEYWWIILLVVIAFIIGLEQSKSKSK